MAGTTRNCCRVGTSSLYIICTIYAKPRTQGACVFGCNLPRALLAEGPRVLRAIAATWGWNEYRNKSQQGKLTDTGDENFSCGSFPGIEPATFRSRVQRCTTELSPFSNVLSINSLLETMCLTSLTTRN